MKAFCFILVVTLLASCSSFERMKYRHVQKVPAVPLQFSGSVPVTHEPLRKEVGRSPENQMAVTEPEQISPVDSSADHETVSIRASPIERTVLSPGQVVSTVPAKNICASYPRKDWSVLMALVMIFAGIFLVLFGIVAILNWNIVLVLRIAFGLLFLYAAWKLISYGTMIFIARWRSDKNYRED